MTRRTLIVAAILAVLVSAVAFDQLRLWWGSRSPEDEAARLAALTDIRPGHVVAEIGAGEGAMARATAPRLLPGGRLIVTELGESQLAALNAMVAQERWSHVEVRRGSVSETALEPACCTVIYMRHVFHHFADPAAMSRALYDSLAPGGRLAIIEFPPDWLLGLIAPVQGSSGGHGTTRESLVSFLTSAGFTIEHLEPDWTAGSYLVIARK